jgi:hypothetical protein
VPQKPLSSDPAQVQSAAAAEAQTFQSTYHPLYQKLRESTHGGRRRPDQKPDRRTSSSSFFFSEIHLAVIRTNRRDEIPSDSREVAFAEIYRNGC